MFIVGKCYTQSNTDEQGSKMRNKNICKFVTEQTNGVIKTLNFIYEVGASDGKRCYKDRNMLCLVISGKGRYCCGFTRTMITSGTVFVILSGQEHQIENIDSLQYMYISFYGSRVNELLKEVGISSVQNVFDGYEYLVPLWKSSISRANEKNLELLSESVLLYTFSMLYGEKSENGDAFRDIIEYIEDNFVDNELSLKTISEHFGYNTKYFSSLFSKKLGVSFLEYLTNLRIRYSLLLIDQGVTSVKNIALLSGYSDPLYFSKVFKKHMGTSPREYIEAKQ